MRAALCPGQSYLTEGYELPPTLEGESSSTVDSQITTAPEPVPGEYDDSQTGAPWPYSYSPTTPQYQRPVERRAFESINLAVQIPEGSWQEIPMPSRPNAAVVLLVQQRPEIVVVIGGESVGVELGTSPQLLLKTSQKVAGGIISGMRISDEQPLTVNGIAGTRYVCRGHREGVSVYGTFWTGYLNGYLYHIVAVGQEGDTSVVQTVHQSLVETATPIDATRIAHTSEEELVPPYESKAFGYRVDLRDLGWLKPQSGTLRIPGADFAAGRGHLVLMVLPLPLPNRTVDPELLAQICIERMGLAYPSPDVQATGPCQVGHLPGQGFAARRSHDGNVIDYRFSIAATPQIAYLVIGAAVDGDADSIALVQQAMARVTPVDTPSITGLAPSSENAKACGTMINELGLQLYQRGDLAGAADFFALAYKMHPTEPAVLSNYADVLQELGRTAEALGLLQRHLTTYRGDLAVEALQAKLLGEMGRSVEARQLYCNLFARGHADEQSLSNYLALAKDAKAYDEAITAVRQFALVRPTIDVQLALAVLFSEKGEHDEAIRQLTTLATQNPQNVDVMVALSIAYSDAELFDKAVEATGRLIEAGHRDEIIWLLHGKHQLNAKQFAEAKQTFEQVAAQYPHSEIAKELLQAATDQLGQGNNAGLSTPIAPVEIPAAVRAAIARAPVKAARSLEKYGAEEQVRIVGVSYRRNQPRRTTVSRRIKIHTTGGVAQYKTLEFELNPNGERLFVNRLVVLDAAGKQVATGSVDSYYMLDDTSSGMATNGKIVTVPVPGLKPGYTIECMVTREDRAPSESFGFDKAILSTSVPVGVSVYYVVGDVSNLRYKTSASIGLDQSEGLLCCVMANPVPYRDEAKQPSLERFLPIVWIGESNTSWEQETKDYLGMVSDQLALDDSTRALAGELTRDCRSNREKLAVLAGYAQSACTYHAIEFGRRARVPNTAEQTLALKYGDCKDHSLLLKQLLAGVGIESHLAVVNSSQPIASELPSLDQFDHMVLFVPGEAIGQPQNEIGGLIVDATAKNSDPLLFPPCGLADKSFLVLDPGRPRVVHSPRCPPDAQQLTCQRRISVHADASQPGVVEVLVQERLTFNAYMAPGLRGFLRSFEAGERRAALQSVLGTSQNVRLKRAEIEHLDDPSQPLVIYLEYQVPDAMHALSSTAFGNTVVGRVPAFWETYFLEAEYSEARETPFEIGTPKLVRSNIEIVLPAGYYLSDIDRLTGTGRTRFAAWASQARQQQDGPVVFDYVVRVPAGRFTAAEYQEYYAGMKQSLAAFHVPITIQSNAAVAANVSPAVLIK